MNNSSIFSFKIFFLKLFIYIFSLIICFGIALELYNPLKTGAKSTLVFINDKIPELPNQIKINFNNIGYIGENYSDTIQRKKICFIGSSKTLQIYIPFENQWSSQLFKNSNKYWFNNCGQDGTNIYNWINTTNEIKQIKPDFVVILMDPFDENIKIQNSSRNKISKLSLFRFIAIPLYRMLQSYLGNNNMIGHGKTNWNNITKVNYTKRNDYNHFDRNTMNQILLQQIESIKRINATPIFISCPTPFGDYTNNQNIKINKIKGSIETDMYFSSFSKLLDTFCKENKVCFINGYRLKKDTEYFYDNTHFNIKGSKAFADLIKTEILNNLDSWEKPTTKNN